MQRYRTAASLRQALEARLNQHQKATGTDLARLRRRAAFDRLAARLAIDDRTGWILKGGTALEFRLLDRARATKDIDLAIPRDGLDGEAVRRLLREAVKADPDGDWFQYPMMAGSLTEAEADLEVALELVRSFWGRALADEGSS